MSGRHRAPAWEHAERVNAAVRLLGDRAPAAAVRALASERRISERQARRYVAAAAAAPGGVAVPEPSAPLTIRLPRSLLERARSLAAERGTSVGTLIAEALSAHLGQQRARGRRGGQAR
jgi:predicted HicB family RNase H-like nuclease